MQVTASATISIGVCDGRDGFRRAGAAPPGVAPAKAATPNRHLTVALLPARDANGGERCESAPHRRTPRNAAPHAWQRMMSPLGQTRSLHRPTPRRARSAASGALPLPLSSHLSENGEKNERFAFTADNSNSTCLSGYATGAGQFPTPSGLHCAAFARAAPNAGAPDGCSTPRRPPTCTNIRLTGR